MTLLISLAFGNTTNLAIARCKNILEYIPEAVMIVNFAREIDTSEFTRKFSDIVNKTIYINNIPRVVVNNSSMHSLYVKNLLHIHLTNYIFALNNNINFTHIMILSDKDMFIKKGLYNFIKNYDAGYFQANMHVKPLSLNIEEFVPGPHEFIYQRQDNFWINTVFKNKDFTHICTEQYEGQFYKKKLFDEIVNYINALSINYSEAIVSMEEAFFGNIYMNIFREKYPVFLPVSVILRDTSICDNPNRLFNLFLNNDIRKNCRSHETFEVYHPFIFGIKYVDYDKNQNELIENIINITNQYMDCLKLNLNITK